MAFLVNQLRATKKFQDSKQLLVGGSTLRIRGSRTFQDVKGILRPQFFLISSCHFN